MADPCPNCARPDCMTLGHLVASFFQVEALLSCERAAHARTRAALQAEREHGDRMAEALAVAIVEFPRAPCRDNQEHTRCLKCFAQDACAEALAAHRGRRGGG